MSYSVKQYVYPPNKDGRSKVYVQVIVNREKIKIPTNAYAAKDGKLNPANKKIYEQRAIEITSLIELAYRSNEAITKEYLLSGKTSKSQKLEAYISDLVKNVLPGNMSDARITHYNILRDKILAFNGDWLLTEVSPSTMERFASYLATKEDLDPATVAAKIAILIAVINRAIVDKQIPPDVLLGYKRPRRPVKYPTYLTDVEIESFEKYTFALSQNRKKVCGYYFLLACYAGYRISDLYAFDVAQMVHDAKIRLRATKNGKFVTMPVHEKLEAILEFIKDNPIDGIPQQDMREYVKSIAYDAGIKKHVKIHTGRHTFGSTLATNGMSLPEIGEYLGDGKEAAAIYAHLVPNANDEKVKSIFARKEKIKL